MRLLLILFATNAWFLHDLHLSICSIVYNEKEERIEVQQRVFYDDLEKSIQLIKGHEDFNILRPEESSINYDSLFQDYANRHIEFKLNDEEVDLSLLEYEIQDDAIVFYLYKSDVFEIRSIEVFSHILFELFNDQDNVVSVQANGKKKSAKFDLTAKPLQIDYASE